MTYPMIKLPVNFTGAGTSNPVVQNDPILSAGSLFLIDALHSLGGFGTGVPANAASITNVALPQAKTILGSGDATTLSGVVQSTPFTPTAAGFMERTGKSGIHVCTSQVSAVNNQGMIIKIPDAIKTYMLANTGHSFYLSTWYRTTRPVTFSGTPQDRPALIADSTAVGTNYLVQVFQSSALQGAGVYPSTTVGSATYLGNRTGAAADDGTGAMLAIGAASGWNGTPPVLTNLYANFLLGGTLAQNSIAGDTQYKGSRIFYRGYLEDLTVSGRTYATVSAIDVARYTIDMLTAGGRFYGDTYTNPSTLP